MYIVGLTGGIGCGKSTIEKYFRDLQVPVIDTDLITRELQEPGQAGHVYIKQEFGDSVINFDGSLNRDVLRTLVFNDKAAKAKLEMIMSPLIYHEVKTRIAELELSMIDEVGKYVMLTVPLLTESKIYTKLVDRILVIDCPEDVQVERVMKRSGLRKAEVEKILAAQAPRYFRIMKGDDVISNFDCKPEDNLSIVKELHEQYCEFSSKKVS